MLGFGRAPTITSLNSAKAMGKTMSLEMKVDFDDTTKNWQLWGQLVELWICGLQPLPKEVKGLVSQATAHGITSVSVYGSQDRDVKFYWYDDAKELAFMLPTEPMLKAARAAIKPGPYPLPVFYDDAYEGRRKSLTAEQDKLFTDSRVGEYTINNCG
jgi:hypothetical protein